MNKHVDVAIIGAGSAGLSALRQVKKVSDNFLLIDPGPLGTTCARVGCMPSKALIHVANNYHRRQTFAGMGISGADHLQCDIPAVLSHVRTLRDRFTAGMIKATRDLAGERYVEERAVLVGPKRIQIGDKFINAAANIRTTDNGVEVRAGTATATVDKILVAVGVRSNLDELGMETLGVELDEHGMPQVDPHTSQIADLPVYLAGDAHGYAPVLHEALDEGFIAGRHSFGMDGASACYCRRPLLRIVFSDPQCAVVGQSFAALRDTSIVIGQVDFRQQARAIIEGRNAGLLRLYADALSGQILGAEMVAPEAEHLAHLLAACIHANMTVHDALRLPYYHPTLEEGLRTALRDAAAKLPKGPGLNGYHLCGSCPEPVLQ